jgi:hypothetical protein
MTKTIKIGDKVIWRGHFGTDLPMQVTVKGLEVTDEPRGKYGKDVDEVSTDLVEENRVVFDLENGCWAYSDQIDVGK